jgi:hypothetical protein
VTLSELQERAWVPPEEFHENAYVCVIHGVAMTDEFPRVNPKFRGKNPYDGALEAGMVVCVESFMGAVGEPNGVKLEQQVLITDVGIEYLTTYPLDVDLPS